MHIGDGLLDLAILIPLWIIVGIYGIVCLIHIKRTIKEEQLPIASVLTAMVFAFQMLNFPIAAGTSGHFLGFILMAILISPSAAFFMISVILIIQAFIFGDGGILALGANIFNMGIVTLFGYIIYWVIRKKLLRMRENNSFQDKGLILGTFAGAYLSVLAASVVCGIEIGLSTAFPYPIGFTIPAMLGYHALIALGEGLITSFVILFFKRFAPEYIPDIRSITIWS